MPELGMYIGNLFLYKQNKPIFQDGASAWEAKDFLIEQERCLEVQIEQVWPLTQFLSVSFS